MNLFSFVAAASNSGKTTLIEKVVRLLKAKGLRLAVIKHASKGFELQEPELDGYLRAGADSVLVAGCRNIAVIKKINALPAVEEIQKVLPKVDITLYEGFKADAGNKIEVFRQGISGERPLCLADSSYIALASDKRFETGIPQFDLNDGKAVADFILEKYEHEF